MTQQVEEMGNAAQERHCIHYREQATGNCYSGTEYVEALQRLKGSAAMKAASNVEAFFWRDASMIKVWLCQQCASVMSLKTSRA